MDTFPKTKEYKLIYADALYAHSWMEYQLSELFTYLIGCEYAEGSKVFYNMDYRRYHVISDIIQNKFPNHWTIWKKLRSWIYLDSDSISSFRNKIVHWRMVGIEDGGGLADPALGEALLYTLYNDYDKFERISAEDLVSFTKRTSRVSQIINQLHTCIASPEYEEGFEVFKNLPKNITPDELTAKIHKYQTRDL